MKPRAAAGVLCLIGTLSGCASSTLDAARGDFYRRDYAAAEVRLAPLSAEEGRNAVLAAMERGTALHMAAATRNPTPNS